jgi:hypothetical protein
MAWQRTPSSVKKVLEARIEFKDLMGSMINLGRLLPIGKTMILMKIISGSS